ncbi:MAG: PKD domain-containing protein, partial [bacterium]|nr:PKD domain-containing protein [bacterium]
FFGAPTCGEVPLSVQFYDISYGAPTCWNWSFGDGSTSINQNPLHIYNTLGKYTVTLIANNAYGSSTISKPNYILVQDTTSPTGSIIINSGASYTNSTVVTLSLSATDAVSGVSTMRLSNDSTTWTPWESFTTSRSWYVTSGDGTKTVYVQFKDSAGNQSGSYTDTIILDMTAPSGGTVSINTGATYTRNTNVSVSWSGASDSYGIASVGLRNTISEPTTWYAYSINSTLWTLSAGYGTKTVYAVFKDNAGNVSGAVSDTIVYVATVELRVESSPETGAYITVSPTDNNGNSSGYTNFIRNYDQGTDIYLTAPSSYNEKPFAKWSKDGTDYSNNPSVKVNMDDSHTMVAEYQLESFVRYGEFTTSSDTNYWYFEPYGDASSPGGLGLDETYGFLVIYQIPGQKAKLSQVFAVDTGWYTAKAKVWTTVDNPAKHQKVYLYLQELDNTNAVVASGNQVIYDGSGYFPGAWQVNPVNDEMEISYYAQDTKLAVQLVAINKSYSGITGCLCVDYIRVYPGASQPLTIVTTFTFEDTTGWVLEPYGDAAFAGVWTWVYSNLILSQDSGMKGKASQNCILKPGEPALISAWVYSDASTIDKAQKVYLYCYDNTSGYTQIIDSGNVILQPKKWTPEQWHQLQFVYIPVSEYNTVQLVGINRNPADDGLWEALYFDEVQVKQE